MQTVYVDIYFLINFTVDFLALYFACAMTKIPTTILRLLLGGSAGALTAVANLFIANEAVGYLALFAGFLLTVFITTKRVTLYRRFKFAFCFSVIEMLLGGMVYFAYGFLNKKLGSLTDPMAGGSEHRGILILAVVVLASIGVFKCLVSVFAFSAGCETVEVDIRINGRRVVAEALVDTGNLAKDPFNMKSVVLIEENVAERLLHSKIKSSEDLLGIDQTLGCRLRLIPVTFGKVKRLLIGFSPDAVYVKTKRGLQEIDVVVAIDKDGGGYGGREALVPSVVIRDVY